MTGKNVEQRLKYIYGDFDQDRGKWPRDPNLALGSPVAYAIDPVTVTLAEVNAGKTIIPARVGNQLHILNFTVKSTGAFAALTSILIQDTADTPIVVATLAQAQLTDGAILFPGETGVTLGAGFYSALTRGKGLQVIKSGSAGTTATNIIVTVTYKYTHSA